MPVVPTRELLDSAVREQRGIAAFNAVNLETAEALVAAADAERLPLIIQVSENAVRYHGGLEPITAAVRILAEGSIAPIALHLDHAEDIDLALHAIGLGYGSVMYDGARRPYEENVRSTRRVAERARAAGVLVEAELGEIGGKDGAHAPGVRTDPAEARRFVEETGIDALAVAVGSSHASTSRTGELDLLLIGRLRTAAGIPLVLHGSSGVSDDTLAAAIASGIRKVNVSTHFNVFFTTHVREVLGASPTLVDPRRYLGPARDAMQRESQRMLRLISAQPTRAPGP